LTRKARNSTRVSPYQHLFPLSSPPPLSVSRLTGYSQTQEKETTQSSSSGTIEITLDYASELIAFHKNEIIRVTLARSLERDYSGSAEEGGQQGKREMWRGGDEGLAADFDYVMYGKVSRVDGQR
jgi:hypothetical protein